MKNFLKAVILLGVVSVFIFGMHVAVKAYSGETPGNLSPTPTPIKLTHNECVQEAAGDITTAKCEVKDGEGKNQCLRDGDCFIPGSGFFPPVVIENHNECAVGEGGLNVCKEINSPGINECNSDDDCASGRNNICVNQRCLLGGGHGGFNQCYGDFECGVTSSIHTECSQETCIYVAGKGDDQCRNNSDCKKSTHFVCVDDEKDPPYQKCVEKDGPGSDQCNGGEYDCRESGSTCQDMKCVFSHGNKLCQENSDCLLGSSNYNNSSNTQNQPPSTSSTNSTNLPYLLQSQLLASFLSSLVVKSLFKKFL